MNPNSSGDRLDLRRLGSVAARHRWLILGTLAISVLIAAVITHLQRPVYESEAVIRLQDEKPGLSLISERLSSLGLGQMAGAMGSDIRSDIAVLESRTIAETVVDSLDLHVRLVTPDTARVAVLDVLQAPHGRDKREVVLEWTPAEEGYRVRRGAAGSENSSASVQIGQPFKIGEVVLRLRPELRAAPPGRIEVVVDPYRHAVAEVQKSLRVLRPDPAAQVLGIRYRSGDSYFAAAVPNLATASFIAYKNRVNASESQTTMQFLREQAEVYDRRLAEAEARLQAFREQAQIVDPKTQASEQVKRLAELQTERDALVAERDALGRVLSQMEPGSGGRAGGQSPYRELASFPSLLTNPAVHNLLFSITELETERSRLLIRRTEQDAEVEAINRRIADLELQLYRTARNYLQGLQANIGSLNAVLSGFSSQLAQVPGVEAEFVRLARDQRLLEQVSTLIETKLKETEIQASADPASVQVIDAALVPQGPVSPRPLLNLLLALVVGTVVGAGAAIARELLDTRVRTRDDLNAAAAGLPVLGSIPRVRVRAARDGTTRKRLPTLSRGAVLVRHPLFTRSEPDHPASEAYRVLRTNILVGLDSPRREVLVVTSPTAEDGKSTSASNLAVTMAQQGMRTLLIDADLRLGLLHVLFGVEEGIGLVDVLKGDALFDEARHELIVGTAGGPLHLLTRGTPTPIPSELLSSARTQELLRRLRGQYDVIIIDAPPLSVVVDGAVLGTWADSTILVARVGSTDRRALQEAVEQLRYLRAAVGGVILNGVDAADRPYVYSRLRSGQVRVGALAEP